jgi:glycosyltransferase involved in cell wall biosynthesis
MKHFTVDPKSRLPEWIAHLRATGSTAPEYIRAFSAIQEEPTRSARASAVTSDALVSCLMVSRNVPAVVLPSIRAYLAQTHRAKELVIVRDPSSSWDDLAQAVADLGRADIKLVRVAERSSLSALRNEAIKSASGSVLCNWDDDDLSHPERLRVQLDAIVSHQSAAAVLQENMHHFVESGEVFWTSYETSTTYGLPGTIMWRRACAPAYSAEAAVAEFSEDSVLFFRMAGPIAVIAGAPHLFVYRFHGHNTWNEGHHRRLVARCKVDVGPRSEKLRAELRRMGLETTLAETGTYLRCARSSEVSAHHLASHVDEGTMP